MTTSDLLLWPTDTEPRVHIHHPLTAPRAALVIFRGGGYATARGSGGDSVPWATKAGFVAVQVDYGAVERGIHFPRNVQDGARAVRLARSLAPTWGVEKVYVLGFSAGAHLASLLATGASFPPATDDDLAHLSSRPDAVVLSYGVLSFVEGYSSGSYAGSVDNFFGRAVTESERRSYSPELLVTPATPPVFCWTIRPDDVVPHTHTALFATACRAAGVPVTELLYEQGEHAIGMAGGTGFDCEAWGDEALAWFATL